MHSEQSDNAMTEVALALAMAFFSILTLNLMSIGSGQFSEPARASDSGARSVEVVLADNGGDAPENITAGAGEEMTLIIYFKGGWFDRRLNEIDPEDIRTNDRVLLAIDESLPFSEAVAARKALAHLPLTLVALDNDWITALRRQKP